LLTKPASAANMLAAMETSSFGVVAILGPGLIGGSLGLALRQRRLAQRVVGIGHRATSIEAAKRVGAIDEGALDAAAGVKDADLIVIATSVAAIPRLAAEIMPHVKPGAVLTDVGSVKREIVTHIEASLRGDVAFIGGHPMAGSEKRGVEAAQAGLFEGSICILTPTPRTPASEVARVSTLWAQVGAHVHLMSPEQHDELVALVSHLPHLAAAALVNVLPEHAWRFVASGFRDTTRVASSDPALWRDICAANRSPIAASLSRFAQEIAALAQTLQDGRDADLLVKLEAAKRLRDAAFNPK